MVSDHQRKTKRMPMTKNFSFSLLLFISVTLIMLSGCGDSLTSNSIVTTKVYVSAGKGVYIINQTQGITTVTSIELPADGGYPGTIKMNNAKNKVYAGNYWSFISVIDAKKDTLITTTEDPTRNCMDDMAFSPDDSKLYMVHVGPEGVSVYDPNSLSESGFIHLSGTAGAPQRMAITPDGSKLYISDYGGTSEIFSINTVLATQGASVLAGNTPRGLAVTNDGRYLLVANQGDNTVSVISTTNESLISNIPGFSQPYDIAITGDDGYAYVTNFNGNTISRINLSDLTIDAFTATVEAGPRGIALTQDGSYIYVACTTAGKVDKINLNNGVLTDSFTVGINPYEIIVRQFARKVN
jgi:YVTN family beta-propeller protein